MSQSIFPPLSANCSGRLVRAARWMKYVHEAICCTQSLGQRPGTHTLCCFSLEVTLSLEICETCETFSSSFVKWFRAKGRGSREEREARPPAFAHSQFTAAGELRNDWARAIFEWQFSNFVYFQQTRLDRALRLPSQWLICKHNENAKYPKKINSKYLFTGTVTRWQEVCKIIFSLFIFNW